MEFGYFINEHLDSLPKRVWPIKEIYSLDQQALNIVDIISPIDLGVNSYTIEFICYSHD